MCGDHEAQGGDARQWTLKQVGPNACESFEVDFSMQQAVVRCSALLDSVKSLKNGYPKVVPAAGLENGTMGSVPGGDTKLTGSKKW